MNQQQHIRVVIADDQELVRAGFAMVIGSQADMEVVGQAGDGNQAVALAQELHPDVVLMDVRMPIMDGLDSARLIVKSDPAAKIIMLSAMGDEDLMKSAKEIGIRVFLQKPFKSDEMMKAIAQVMGASGA